jgi:hypothetical protein
MLSLDSSVSSDLKNDKVFSMTKQISPEAVRRINLGVPRLNLRKRSYTPRECHERNLPAVNSTFLSSLFADVAAAQQDTSCVANSHHKSQDSIATEIGRYDATVPCKRSKLDLKSLSRCPKSYKSLARGSYPCVSPDQRRAKVLDISGFEEGFPMSNNDSLLFQLNCVAEIPSVDDSAESSSSSTCPASLVFPNLPNTISVSSCSMPLTRIVSDLETAIVEASSEIEKDYGWFVEMDDEVGTKCVVDPYSAVHTTTLSFCAPTAPKANNYDNEIEWAKAADTVDDVLGDFF